jgi:hypothetical protein
MTNTTATITLVFLLIESLLGLNFCGLPAASGQPRRVWIRGRAMASENPEPWKVDI